MSVVAFVKFHIESPILAASELVSALSLWKVEDINMDTLRDKYRPHTPF
jgi:hypothetical protein